MDHLSDDDDSINFDNAITNNSAGGGGGGGAGFNSIRDRFRFKRNPNSSKSTPAVVSSLDRQSKLGRSHYHIHQSRSWPRKYLLFPFKERSGFFFCVILVIFLFALASMMLQSSIMEAFRQGGGFSESGKWRWFLRDDLKVGSSLLFVPSGKLSSGLDRLRQEPQIGVRPPRIGLILGNMEQDSGALMLSTVVIALKKLGYLVKTYALLDGEARIMWEDIGGKVTMLNPELYSQIDWSTFEGIISYSIEAHDAIYSLMQEPFCSVPLIWVIHEDILANRLQDYEDMHRELTISHWKSTFRRADAVVFPDYSLPMLYSILDNGNFFVVPGSPVDVWAAESYAKTHTKIQLRKENGFDKDDLLILVVGSSFFYKGLSLNYYVMMDDLEPLLVKYAGREEAKKTFKFVFLCSSSSSGFDDALQDAAARLRLPQGTVRHYGVDADVNGVILMADLMLYASSQEEQGFPPFLTRAMSFGIPIIAPDYPVIGRYVSNGVQGLIFPKNNPEELMKSFALLVNEGKLSKISHSIASAGRQLAKNMFASECTTTYAKLLEDVFNFPSDVLLPGHTSTLNQSSWEWNLLHKEMDKENSYMVNSRIRSSNLVNTSVVYAIEEDMDNLFPRKNVSEDESEALKEDFPTELDWEILTNVEDADEVERLEVEEIEERMEKDIGNWSEIYRNARKAEKIQFETYERDEGELERTGQPVCIYEVYDGAGAWEFLHQGSLYRGLSLTSSARRLRSDDVDAVTRLSLLNDTYYRNMLCEFGGMFSIANRIDNIHNQPWIGFQSWRASGRKVALSSKAEMVLEEVIHGSAKGDIIYFWAKLDIDGGLMGKNDVLTFWSMCDILNGGNCRTYFEDVFRQMYALPSNVEGLPPMPEDGGRWSALHSWVMPTQSFLEFIMFSRMFVDSLHFLRTNSSISRCLLASSILEEKHCYCRVLEILVNVWAYHSARRMVYIDPYTGLLEEQHPIEQRKGFMWVKYFNFTLLKSMDEDLAEAADDEDYPYETWLWPLTGEVYWQGIYERQREERYRLKMEKKRRNAEKLLDRQKHGYKQKTLGR